MNRRWLTCPRIYTGVDYFEPFIIKEGRKEVKRYGALFTCLVSRAVHIEVASSLESNSFILALRRFIDAVVLSEWQWHEFRRCMERVAPSHRRSGSRRDSSQITERKHRLDLQSTRRQPHGWRMGAPDQDHKESSFWLNGRIWPLLG